jgi:hypothetical protein
MIMDQTNYNMGPDDPRGDAAIAAAAAVSAFQAGRIRLGWEFARVAMKAKEWADAAAQLPAPIPIHDEVHSTGAWLPETAIEQMSEAEMVQLRHRFDQTVMSGHEDREDARPIVVPRSTRCVSATVLDGVRVECHGVLAYDEDGSAIGARGWYHLHPGKSTDHVPVPAAPDVPAPG